MATELDTRIWFDKKTDYQSFFMGLINVLDKGGYSHGEYNNFSIQKAVPGNEHFFYEGKITKPQVLEFITDLNGEIDLKLNLWTSLKCLRLNGNEVKDAGVVLSISCWGSKYGEGIGFQEEFEGCASLSLASVIPYYVRSGEKENHVDVNIETYVGMIESIILELNPKKIMTFSDAGNYILSNAHLVYFENSSLFFDELMKFKKLLMNGNMEYDIPKLSDTNLKESSFFFHEWRTLDEVEILKKSLSVLLLKQFSEKSFWELVRNSKVDFYRLEKGIMIFSFPYFLNSFVYELIGNMLHE